MRRSIGRTPRGIGVVVLAGVLTAACAVRKEYPAEWPEREQSGGQRCPDIAGIYANRAVASSRESPYEGRSLYDDINDRGSFFGMHACTNCNVELAWLDEGRDVLRVRLRPSPNEKEEGHTETLRRDRNDFSCENGALLVPFTEGGELGYMGFAEWGKRAYWRAADGSLVRQQNARMLGHVFFVVPTYLSKSGFAYERWVRRE